MKTCFVIHGFNKKQDFATGRVLDLDASYDVIKEAVREAGLECVRADEIRHSGTIDKPMFEQIREVMKSPIAKPWRSSHDNERVRKSRTLQMRDLMT